MVKEYIVLLLTWRYVSGSFHHGVVDGGARTHSMSELRLSPPWWRAYLRALLCILATIVKMVILSTIVLWLGMSTGRWLKPTLPAGSNILVTKGAGSITIGTVTGLAETLQLRPADRPEPKPQHAPPEPARQLNAFYVHTDGTIQPNTPPADDGHVYVGRTGKAPTLGKLVDSMPGTTQCGPGSMLAFGSVSSDGLVHDVRCVVPDPAPQVTLQNVQEQTHIQEDRSAFVLTTAQTIDAKKPATGVSPGVHDDPPGVAPHIKIDGAVSEAFYAEKRTSDGVETCFCAIITGDGRCSERRCIHIPRVCFDKHGRVIHCDPYEL